MRYVAHNPAAWTPQFESYARVRYAWTLSADWPRLAMVQAVAQQMLTLDPVVNDWTHIKAPTLAFGGAEDVLPGSAALFQELTFENGRLQQTNFNTFPVMRMNECPEIETYIVESKEKSGGIGEPGVPCAAPAIANALFAVTGKRVRRLPIRLTEAV
jgi:hypothetical protein